MKKLHELIHNLTQAEKRHIKLRLTNNKDSSLLGIYYEILSKQKHYNIEQVLEESKKPLKLTQSNLSLLYEIILKDLRYISEEESLEIKLRSNISDIKTLVYKGFLDEAEGRCLKLISKAESNEEYRVLLEAYEELWDLYLKRGTLRTEEIQKIQIEIEIASQKTNTLFKLKNWYRIITAHYYNFFFYNSKERLNEFVINIFENVDQIEINSSKANFVYLEIKAIEYLLKSDANRHHEIRKEQLILCLNSAHKEKNKLSILLILSNLFTKLKIDRNIKELEAYMLLLDSNFFDFSDNQKDYILMEKFHDIYFLNHIYLQIFLPNPARSANLSLLFSSIKKKKQVTNEVLLSRIQLGLIELKIFEEAYAEALQELEIYYENFKKNKKSIQFIEAQILEATTMHLLQNFDVFLDKIELINRKVKTHKIDLNNDLKIMLEILNIVSNSNSAIVNEKIAQVKNRQTYKLLMYKLIEKLTTNEIKAKYFSNNDESYNASEDAFLLEVQKRLK